MDETVTPEGAVKHKLKKALDKAFPGHYRFAPVQSGYGAKTLDFLCCIEGLFVAFETKAFNKMLTPLQVSTVQDMMAAGALTYVIDRDEAIVEAIARIQLALRFNNGRRDH
jgi:hypothetical protein